MTLTLNKIFLCLFIFYDVAVAVNIQYYPRYHLAPPHGWMNDPNGFCVFKNKYHLFYQYNPESSLEAGIAHWGHAVSEDLVYWKHLEVAMKPDEPYDKTGVFSGSALIENDTMYLFYTGNVNHPNENPDHEQHQALAISTDGVNVQKYENNPIIIGANRQPNFRDPKVWEHNGTYYMVLGNSFDNNTLGRALLYSSTDKISWEEKCIIDESDGTLGYMWECPDLFELNGLFVLLFSPQGIKAEGDNYKNLYQTGYFLGLFDYDSCKFTRWTNFTELDHGHDFYATQTTEDSLNRRIVIAWLDMWDQNYPEGPDGFTGMMSNARELSISLDGRLIQKPIKELEAARGKSLFSGKPTSERTVTLEDKAGEVIIRAPAYKNFELLIMSDNQSSLVTITYDYESSHVSLDRGGTDGIRRTEWRPWGTLKWRVFIDASSIELYCGEGEVTFSSRFFPEGNITIGVGKQSEAYSMVVNEMMRTVPLPS